MGVSELRSELIKMLGSIEDEQLLRAVYSFLENRQESESGKMWKGLTIEQRKEVLAAYEDSENEANLIDDRDIWKEVE